MKDVLKNNFSLPGTGRVALIMFKLSMAGDDCKVSAFLLAQGPGTGEMKSPVKSCDL